MRKRLILIVAGIVAVAGVAHALMAKGPPTLVLTGIVTTDDVIVSPQVAGRVDELRVDRGDSVKPGDVLAVIAPDELKADQAYYTASAQSYGAQVQGDEAALRYQERQARDQVRQAAAALAASQAQLTEARASQESARLARRRVQDLFGQGIASTQDDDQARTTFEAAAAHVDALEKQVDAQRAVLALARANADQVSVKRSQLQATQHAKAAADAQQTKADVRLGYAEVRAPIAGFVDVRAVRPGEVVSAGQPLLTLVNPDDLWVRADVEETYIDRVTLGQEMTVRLPSGDERVGRVIYRGQDAGFATQRDVSRTKRDIKTFEVRLRVDNSDRRLAVGMTAYVLLPVPPPGS